MKQAHLDWSGHRQGSQVRSRSVAVGVMKCSCHNLTLIKLMFYMHGIGIQTARVDFLCLGQSHAGSCSSLTI